MPVCAKPHGFPNYRNDHLCNDDDIPLIDSKLTAIEPFSQAGELYLPSDPTMVSASAISGDGIRTPTLAQTNTVLVGRFVLIVGSARTAD